MLRLIDVASLYAEYLALVAAARRCQDLARDRRAVEPRRRRLLQCRHQVDHFIRSHRSLTPQQLRYLRKHVAALDAARASIERDGRR